MEKVYWYPGSKEKCLVYVRRILRMDRFYHSMAFNMESMEY